MRKKTLWLLGISLLFGSTGICIGNLVFYAGNLCITVICNSGTKIVKTYVIRACTLTEHIPYLSYCGTYKRRIFFRIGFAGK